jgi:hypothetical protein
MRPAPREEHGGDRDGEGDRCEQQPPGPVAGGVAQPFRAARRGRAEALRYIGGDVRHPLHRYDQPIATLRNGLEKPRMIDLVAERPPQFGDDAREG